MQIHTALLATVFPATLFAQKPVTIRPQRPATEAVVSPMFRLDPRAANHSLSAHLPGDALLTVESRGLSYWPAKTELAHIAALALGAVRGVQDSFRSATSEKCVAIHLPTGGESQVVQYTENTAFSNLVIRSGTAQVALKAGFDTVRVLKTYGITEKTKKDSAQPQQIQYTFILKSLADFESVVRNTALLDDVARTMDSVVAVRRKRWGRDDAWYHSLEAVYHPERQRSDKERLLVQRGADKDGDRGIFKGLEAGGAFGATLLRNTLTPTVDFGIGYRWPMRNRDESRFLRVSSLSLLQFKEQPDKWYQTQSTTFVNLEFGRVYNRPQTLLPLYRTSFGVGWAYGAGSFGGNDTTASLTDAPLRRGTVRIFFTYSASKNISVVPEIFTGGNTSGLLPAVSVRIGL